MVLRDPTNRVLRIHRLVQEVTRDSLSEEEKKEWAAWALMAVYSAFMESDAPLWELRERLSPQALTLLEHAESVKLEHSLLWRVLIISGLHFVNKGDHMNGAALLRRAEPFENDPAILLSIARAYVKLGKDDDASEVLKRGLSQISDETPPEREHAPRILLDLSLIAQRKERYDDAEKYASEALTASESVFGVSDVRILPFLLGLAVLQAARLLTLYKSLGYIDFG
jgi:tetratricopeptide (TPR) repeat protein